MAWARVRAERLSPNPKMPRYPTSPLLTLHDPHAAPRYYEAGLWREDTLYSLLCGLAERIPHRFALRDGARRLTWRGLKGWVDAAAGELHGMGLRRGERVALWTSNRVECVVALLACARNGYVCNPSLHRNYTVEEVHGLLQWIRARAVVMEAGYGADAGGEETRERLSGLPGMRRVILLPSSRETGAEFPAPDAGPGDLPEPERNPDAVCYLAFTSGTTGKPKGVMHSHNTLLALCRCIAADWGLDERSVALSLSPLSHHIAWLALGESLAVGMELVLEDPPAGTSLLDWAVETGATYLLGVPTHAMDLLAEQKRRGAETLGSVKVFFMGGSPIPRSLAESYLAQGVTPQNVYGMTENSAHQYTHPDDDTETICATTGRGGPSYEVRIFDQAERDREVPPGTVGEIGGRGAALMLGYFDNQAATEDSFNRDGWFLSGDLGQVDERGNLKIVGRLKDVVNRGGHKIHPARIEVLAMRHPAIEKAAAFPVPDERLGEKVCLAASGAQVQSLDPQAVLTHLDREGLSKYDMPEYFIAVESFPLTASGKILKRELAQWAADGRIRPTPVRWGGASSSGAGGE